MPTSMYFSWALRILGVGQGIRVWYSFTGGIQVECGPERGVHWNLLFRLNAVMFRVFED